MTFLLKLVCMAIPNDCDDLRGGRQTEGDLDKTISESTFDSQFHFVLRF